MGGVCAFSPGSPMTMCFAVPSSADRTGLAMTTSAAPRLTGWRSGGLVAGRARSISTHRGTERREPPGCRWASLASAQRFTPQHPDGEPRGALTTRSSEANEQSWRSAARLASPPSPPALVPARRVSGKPRGALTTLSFGSRNAVVAVCRLARQSSMTATRRKHQAGIPRPTK